MIHEGTPEAPGNGHITDRAQQELEKVRDMSERLLGKVEDFVRERPGTAVLCALGLGFLVGKLIRR
jgi:ElaB/YqjD/DUF883 family membrane-anchored ribosome-binding protein